MGTAAQATARSEAAAQTLFTAASAATAIPVAGVFVGAGLAIAGLFTKIFGGRKKRKREEAARKAAEKRANMLSNYEKSTITQGDERTTGGAGVEKSILPGGARVPSPPTPTFKGGGGTEPTVAAVHNAIGLK
jgi:hypothetical protein